MPIRAEAHWLACTDKVCVPEQGELCARPAGRDGPADQRARFDEWRRALPRPLASAGAVRSLPGDKLRVAIPLPRERRGRQALFLPGRRTGRSTMPRRRVSAATATLLIAELQRRDGAPEAASPACWRSATAAGWSSAQSRATSRKAARRSATSARKRDPAARCSARSLGGLLLNLMPCVFPILALKALHLAQGGRRASAGAARRAGLCGGRGGRHRRARRRSAGDPRRREREAGWAFQLQDPRTIMLLLLLATAITAQPARAVRAAGARRASAARRAASGPARWRPSSRRPAPGRSLARRWARRCCCRSPARSRCSPRSGWAWRSRSCWSPSSPRCASGCRSRARGWSGCSASSPSRWRRRRSAACGCSIARRAQTALAVGIARRGRRLRLAVCGGLGQRQGTGRRLRARLLRAGAGRRWPQSQVPRQPRSRTRVPAGAEPWSEARSPSICAQGQPVFVYFTADWCLTCKANEAAAIDREEVARRVQARRA